ncbi:2,3-bisphosphoglycerate-independent phosphoglycerate mutase [Perkinsela sp. CCAP 1560/4]|nr:2,3-bisphosphoglycerate-independent phosphoglycerate mutase [Perkinsela sp. CCAP 1560/4]|eukprot:KNH09580.1 2,3-bisphosphoglycerate-independent phosphoglycerate mutase [Perkinsela sp. CCAP 1560/4]
MQLSHHPIIPRGKPVLVVVLDGVGVGQLDQYNAVNIAKTPVMDALFSGPRYMTVKAHGKAVGLPSDSDMGNSEVGHNALGSGRVITQGASLVDQAFTTGEIFQSSGYNYLRGAFTAEGQALHLICLLSNGGVHSHTKHLYGIIAQALLDGAQRIRVHILLDGRDVPEGTSSSYIQDFEDRMAKQHPTADVRIASGGGRMHVTMDRYEADWSIVERGWKAHVLGESDNLFTSASSAVTTLKSQTGCSDQYIPPFCIVDEATKQPIGCIQDGDAVLCMNYRGDRVIEISKAFEETNFDHFPRKRHPNVRYAGMIRYDGDQNIPKNFLVQPPHIEKTSGEYLAATGVRVFACSETQKFGHVTYFWNGNRSGKFSEELETYAEIKSDTGYFGDKPEMKAREITNRAIQALKSDAYDMVRINIANGDMVGHTGEINATKIAIEVIDECLGELLRAVDEVGGSYLITADHGNADDMTQRDSSGKPLRDAHGEPLPLTSHTLAPVPVVIGGPNLPANVTMRSDIVSPGLSNVTATFINLMGYNAPDIYDCTLLHFSKE